ncbi:tetratricopeptide repeat protein 16 isoform X3 [Dendropsophus ebraccatus]|uniref:tetratricopeptide repeat protein 16 isoform X3 n=1 Tax=Dendropsophus ebraccatus TaxID=150705 RepID=UPI003831B98A
MEKTMAEGHTTAPEEMTGDLFPTEVSEETLQEARNKSLKKLFGSSQVFLDVHSKSNGHTKHAYEDIVQGKMTEHYERGLQCLAQKEWEKAVIAFSKAINLCPQKVELYVKRAEAFLQLCDFQSAALNLRKASSIAPPLKEHIELLAHTYCLQGQSLFDQNRHLEALESFTRAAELQPQNRHYHMCRGTVYKKLKDFSPAVEDFVRAMQLCNAEDRYGSEAAQLQTEAENQLLLTYNDFAVHCYMKGFYQEGVQLLNKALKGDRSKKELYMNRGDCFFQLGELAFALADYQQAFDLDEEDWGVRTRLARLLDELGLQAQNQRQYQQAESHFSEAIMKHPLLPQVYLHRARLRRSVQNITVAQEDAVISILLNPKGNETTPTIMNFFPGKTLEELITSQLASSAQCALTHNLESIPVRCRDNIQSTCGQKDEALPETRRDLAVCMTVQQLSEMVGRKRKLKTDIQAALDRQGYLKSTAPRITRPPPPQEETPDTNAPYNWKTFGLGLMSTR